MKPTKTSVGSLLICVLATALELCTADVLAQAKKPNILVIFGDDIGYRNGSIYNRGNEDFLPTIW